MKRLMMIVVLAVCFVVSGFARYYIGVVTKTVNLREGPSTYYDIVGKVAPKTYVFVDTDDSSYDFYSVICVKSGDEGYISTKYVKLLQEVEVDRNGHMELVGEAFGYDPEVTIKNTTAYRCTIKIGTVSYKFAPYETRTITFTSGQKTIVASAPGVIPYVGSDYLESGYAYSWEFYVRTTRH